MGDFSSLIQDWYMENKRNLPWRNHQDPYLIWLSEIILQQTQVVQGLSYYEKFSQKYPTVKHLAKADQDEILNLWQGLGYYSRARNLHFAAKQIVTEFDGNFPTTYDNIIKLKGVGEYTAAAISSFAFGLPKAVVDGNVYRVLSRIYQIDTPINSTNGKKEFQALANELIDHQNPDIHNQAIMELGALVCKPNNPNCETCPVHQKCESFANKSFNSFPVKLKKVKVKNRFLNYIVVQNNGNTLLRKREGKGIWQGLYEFPMIESTESVDKVDYFKNLNQDKLILSHRTKHLLTHQKLEVSFWVYQDDYSLNITDFKKIKNDSIRNYPVPQVIARYIEESHFFKR